jgi:hypothetical protein
MPIAATLSVFNPPYGLDLTNQRTWLRGKLIWTAGTYVAGGQLPVGAYAPWKDVAGDNVLVAAYSTPPVASITNSVLTSNVVTITATNALVAGQYVTFSGLTNIPSLNGLTLIVSGTGLSTSAFEVALTHANVLSAVETGNAVVVIGPDDMTLTSQSGSGYIYQYNKANATIQILTTGTASGDGLNELAAGALPSGVTGDVINWVATYCKA